MADPSQNPTPNLRIEGLIVFKVQRMGDALGIFPDGPEKEALSGLIDFCIERTY